MTFNTEKQKNCECFGIFVNKLPNLIIAIIVD